MSDDTLDRLLGPKTPRNASSGEDASSSGPRHADDVATPPGEHPAQPVAPVWVGSCLRLAGEASVPALTLRLRNGRRVALANTYFSAARLESGDQLEVDFVGHALSIRGRRLGAVFEALAAQRALELAEAPSSFDEDTAAPFIETIAIVSTQER